jgi:hypothetical protein
MPSLTHRQPGRRSRDRQRLDGDVLGQAADGLLEGVVQHDRGRVDRRRRAASFLA